MSHRRSACCHEVSAATRGDQSRISRIRRMSRISRIRIRISRAVLVSVFGSSVEVVLVGGFLILTRSLLSKD